jgi:hypothetical protein
VFVVIQRRPPEPVPSGNQVAVRAPAVNIDWSREAFLTWKSLEDGVSLEYPARYEAMRGFGRFTSRSLAGGLTEMDVGAFRTTVPRSVIAVATYRAAKPLAWDEWIQLAKAPYGPTKTPSPASALSLFAAEFGGSDKEYRRLTLDGRPGLEVTAKGAVQYPLRGSERWEMWRFESRLFADGDRAARLTAGVHEDQWPGAREGLRRTVESFRWKPPAADSR